MGIYILPKKKLNRRGDGSRLSANTALIIVSGCEATDLSIFNKGVPMLKDFRDFISRGSVIDLAIGVIIGASFTAIVNSLVGDMFMPIVGAMLGGVDFEGLAFQIGE